MISINICDVNFKYVKDPNIECTTNISEEGRTKQGHMLVVHEDIVNITCSVTSYGRYRS